MAIKLIAPCVGKASCVIFSSADALLDALGTSKDFRNLMHAMEIVGAWRKEESCPFRVQKSSDGSDGFHVAVCSLGSKPPYSMEAVSTGTGYSKTCVAKIEYSAFSKIRRLVGKDRVDDEVLEEV
jgi:hypothetical protein